MASGYPNLPQEEKPLERCGFESEPTFDPQCNWDPGAWGGMMKTWAGRKGYAFAQVNDMLGGTGLAAGEGVTRANCGTLLVLDCGARYPLPHTTHV